ncbi:hypothetical protein [Actinacidiphila acidipaludis]|uniref:Secreted protein n=1 Tax=Actinacidiphila acidipaludis TaxID=2873382 RepID=A0ABS7Q718_9ACTN|nr:hypothetical protein [Streptomyces acidipaludis]MBY8878733.1 hypothetical protein [Streptomyces acidipaludis]
MALLCLTGLGTTARAASDPGDGTDAGHCVIVNFGSGNNNACHDLISGNSNTTGTGHTVGTTLGSVQYSQGFHITNIEGVHITLASVSGGPFEGAVPALGSEIPENGYHDYEVQFRAASVTTANAVYNVTGFEGASGQVTFLMQVDALDSPSVTCDVNDNPTGPKLSAVLGCYSTDEFNKNAGVIGIA